MIVPVLLSALWLVVAAAPAAPNPAVLREVTYKVSEGVRTSSAGEQYSGFSSSGTVATDNGTVTVDITGVQGDALGLNITEVMNKTGRPATNSGSVTPDGLVVFPPQSIQDVTRELLQYFAPQFIPADKLTMGSGWDVDTNQSGVEVKSNYKVTKVDGPLLTVAVHQTVKVAAQNVTITSDGTIVMKPSLLVPVSGDVQRTMSRVTVSGDTKTVTSMHFERVSDSKDQAPQ